MHRGVVARDRRCQQRFPHVHVRLQVGRRLLALGEPARGEVRFVTAGQIRVRLRERDAAIDLAIDDHDAQPADTGAVRTADRSRDHIPLPIDLVSDRCLGRWVDDPGWLQPPLKLKQADRHVCPRSEPCFAALGVWDKDVYQCQFRVQRRHFPATAIASQFITCRHCAGRRLPGREARPGNGSGGGSRGGWRCLRISGHQPGGHGGRSALVELAADGQPVRLLHLLHCLARGRTEERPAYLRVR